MISETYLCLDGKSSDGLSLWPETRNQPGDVPRDTGRRQGFRPGLICALPTCGACTGTVRIHIGATMYGYRTTDTRYTSGSCYGQGTRLRLIQAYNQHVAHGSPHPVPSTVRVAAKACRCACSSAGPARVHRPLPVP